MLFLCDCGIRMHFSVLSKRRFYTTVALKAKVASGDALKMFSGSLTILHWHRGQYAVHMF